MRQKKTFEGGWSRCSSPWGYGATGRWLVPDPAAQFANPYLAMGNNPVVGVDPDGRFVHILIGAGIGGLINLGVKAMNGEINSFGEGLAAFGVGAVAGGLTAATGGAMLAAAGGVGAGGFAGGFVIGAMSTTAGNVVLSEGNHYFFNDPRWDDKQYLTSALMGGVLGGVANGFAAKGQGKSFWTGGEKSELLNILPPGPGSNPKPYTGRTGNGGATNEMLYDELGNPINPKAIIYNESAGPELRIFGERSGSTIKVENFKYNEVVDYISHDASQVRPFSNAPGSEIIHLTPDGAILRYQAYPVSRTTSAPTIKLSYWNSTSETFEHWMTFRFTP